MSLPCLPFWCLDVCVCVLVWYRPSECVCACVHLSAYVQFSFDYFVYNIMRVYVLVSK